MLIPDLGASWGLVENVTPQPLYPWEIKPLAIAKEANGNIN
jgi:hypothetical protein